MTSKTLPSAPAMLDAVKRKCIEANPELQRCICCKLPISEHSPPAICGRGFEETVSRPIRLSDVLLAADHYRHRTSAIDILLMSKKAERRWDLFHDSLDDQSPETISFLFSLLCE
jgi:hypothetical protein